MNVTISARRWLAVCLAVTSLGGPGAAAEPPFPQSVGLPPSVTHSIQYRRWLWHRQDRVLPDQIHNYAHNNEWLIRDLMLLGRVREALELAKNMIELPRHPRYNALNGRGSASLGRERLLGVLTSYRLWPQLVELANSVYLEATSDELKQDERNAWLAIAYSQSGEMAKCKKIQDELTSLLVSLRSNAVQGRETLRLLAEADSHDTKKAITRPPKLLEPYPWSEEPFGEDDDPSTPKMPSREIDDSIAKDWTEERK